jgi:hypothetical protein
MINSLETLDKVLKYLEKSTENEPCDLELEIPRIISEISNRDKKAIIDKLIKDKYVDNIKPNYGKFINNRNYQFITFEGLLLLEESGGYVGKAKKEKQLSRALFTLQIIIAVGALVTAIYYIIDLYYCDRK